MKTTEYEMGTRNIARILLIAILLFVLWLGYRVIHSYLDPIILAVVLAALMHPFYRRLRRRLKGRANPAAFLSCVLVLLILLGPVGLMGGALVRQGISSLDAIQEWAKTGGLDGIVGSGLVSRLEQAGESLFPGLDLGKIDLAQSLTSASSASASWLLKTGGSLLGQAGIVVGKLALMIFVLFYFLRDGAAMLSTALHLLPLRSSQEERLIQRFRTVSRSAILGAFGTAAAQGLVGGIGLAIVGIPALFWGAVMALASLIPVVGTALVWVPAALYLLAIGSWGKALFLAIFCGVAVGSIDNLLRPMLMSGQSHMSTLWLFLAILGGVDAFGLMGLIYGPLVFGLLSVLFFLYEEEFKDFLNTQDES